MQTTEDKLLAQRKKAKKRRTIKRIIFYIILLAAIVYGLYAYNFHLKTDRWPWQPEVVENPMDSLIQTKVYESTYTTSIDISGSVQAYQTQDVVMRASGAVKGIYVKEGDRVVKGQLLAEVDSTSQTYNVSDIEWRIEKAEISGTSSEKDLELMRMQLDSAKQQLENTKAYANFDGVVVKVSVDEGDYSNAGSSLMTIIDDSKLKATVEVDEIDLQMLAKGMKATLTSDSAPGETIGAYVSYIPMIGRYSSQGIGVMDVEIVIDNPPKGLKPGFSFEGTINVESEQKMLLVSQSAVTTTRGSSSITKLNEDGSTTVVPVVVKYLGENLYQIISGDVKDGDTVVYSRSASGLAGLVNAFSGMMGGSDFSMPSGGGFSGGMPSGGFGGGMR